MTEQLISLEVAKLAREKGFNEICLHYYREDITPKEAVTDNKYHRNEQFEQQELFYCFTAPTQSLLQKWLREEHGVHLESSLTFGSAISFTGYKGANPQKAFETDDLPYEEALEAGLLEALKLIKS